MSRTVSIGYQDFEFIQKENYFYIDKTMFIQEWWEQGDSVTLITRPRRFGKTLTMSMVEHFFSNSYADRDDLFECFQIWKSNKYRKLQGTYPVISLSFADVKETSFQNARKMICYNIEVLYNKYDFLLEGNLLNEKEKQFFQKVSADMENYIAAASLKTLSNYLYRYYGKKVIILLDEYDAPMQEAYVNGYWNELTDFIRGLFNASFKTNPYLERALMTGITRISKESIFSDLNNLEVITTTSNKYENIFGFTEAEVFTALDEFGLSDKKSDVKFWYDGFTFGETRDIYNPWSIINFLDKKKLAPYWANTSSNTLVGKLIKEGSPDTKKTFEKLLCDEPLIIELDEQIVFDQLEQGEQTIWSLLLAAGYLKADRYEIFADEYGGWKQEYTLKLTNYEVVIMFRRMIRSWFSHTIGYNDFIKALLGGNIKAMNTYMNKITLEMFSSFDTGIKPSPKEPERFYHGFILGLMVELTDRYEITSNRESGFGRYDVMLNPRKKTDDAILLEFKVQDPDEEQDLSATVQEALKQIKDKQYAASLIAKGIPSDQIRSYGFAFAGKKVLIGE